MQGETKPASAVRLFTSRFNSTKCAAADILRALCTAAGRIQLKTEAGDYNVVPTPQDIYQTRSLDNNALIQPESREAFARLLAQGWTDG
jgi:exonuclease III